MKRQLIIVVLAAVVMLLGTYNSSAETCDCMCNPGEGMHEDSPAMPHGMMRHSMERMDGPGDDLPIMMFLMGLGLDEKQKEEAREIESGLMKSTVRMKSDVQIAMMEMKDILDKDPVDMKAVESKLKKTESLLTTMKLSGIKAFEEVKSKLTAGQRIKLREMMEMGPMMGRIMYERPEVH
ncbi:MAG: hypothetical protein ABSB95_12825 [Dissulfurispiraceae bacterium]|jgi:Spy/CpxP family protein refolding chaperone